MSNVSPKNASKKKGWERFTDGVKSLGVAVKSWAGIGFGILGLLTFLFFIFGMFWGEGHLLNTLRETGAARGLITFLVALTTVAIAIILVIFAVASEEGEGNSFKERFALAKEVLTALIGILGTIIGFYYGTAVTQKATKEPVLQVAPSRISDHNPKQGDMIRLNSYVSGGKPPYSYDIIFTPANKLEPVRKKVSSDGYIEEEVKIPEQLPVNAKITFKIDVSDKDGEKVTLDERTKEILVKER